MKNRVLYFLVILMSLGCQTETEFTESTMSNLVQPLSTQHVHTWRDGRVMNRLTGDAIPRATIALVGTQHSTQTDGTGRYRIPVREGFEWVLVSAPGFYSQTTKLGTVTEAWPIVVPEEVVEEYIQRRNRPELDSDPLDDPDLRPEAREFILKRRLGLVDILGTEAGETGLFKQGFDPPDTIRVYRRGPENNSCQGQIDVIPLEEYVKGVVPHEWIPSWTDESLRAGSIAARSFAWGWISRGGKYDCADLDDTTRSQVYKDDRNSRASLLVDSTMGVGIIREGRIVTTEYSAENGDPTAFGVAEPLCTGRELFGHGRGMCQWGTQRWSSQRGQTAEWMVEHYFPNATVSDGQAPTPQIELKQRLSRIDAILCPDPENMYRCADFVRQGWSTDLFDLFVGTRMLFEVDITNVGGAEATDISISLSLPDAYLAANRVETNDQNTENPGAAFDTNIPRLASGESATVTVEIQGTASSVAMGGPAQVKTWIKGIDGIYGKSTWDQAAELNAGQSFNGGELKLLTEIDVYDPRKWTWTNAASDTEQWEGWVPGNATTQLKSDRGLVVAEIGDNAANAPLTLDSPYLPSMAPKFSFARVERTPLAQGRLYWRFENEDNFSMDRSVSIQGQAEVNIPSDFGMMTPFQLRLEFQEPTRITHLELLPSADTPSPMPTIPDAGNPNANAGGSTGTEPIPSPGPSGGISDPSIVTPTRTTPMGNTMTNPSDNSDQPKPASVTRVYMEGGCNTGSGKPASTECLILGILLCLRLAWPRRRRIEAEIQM